MATKPTPSSQHAAVGPDGTTPQLESQTDRLLGVLRFLGRVYVSDVETIHRLLYSPHLSLRTTYRDMGVLTEQRHVWDATVSGFRGGDTHKRTDGGQRQLYGLSRDGKELLKDTGIETDKVIGQLVARDTRGRAPDALRLAHHLQVVMWCVSRLEELRAFPWCTGFHCQSQPRTQTEKTVDARITARFHPGQPRASLVGLPWLDDRALLPGEVEMQWLVTRQGRTGRMHIRAITSVAGEEECMLPSNLGSPDGGLLSDLTDFMHRPDAIELKKRQGHDRAGMPIIERELTPRADREMAPSPAAPTPSGPPRLPRVGRPKLVERVSADSSSDIERE